MVVHGPRCSGDTSCKFLQYPLGRPLDSFSRFSVVLVVLSILVVILDEA